MRKWQLALILTAVAAVAVAASLVATSASAGAATSTPTPSFGPGVCGQLTSNPDAAKAMSAFRAEAFKDMQTWRDKYGSDPTSAAAQQALQKLHEQRWSDMQQLLKKYGIPAPTTAPGAGYGPGMMGGQGRMMGAGFSS